MHDIQMASILGFGRIDFLPSPITFHKKPTSTTHWEMVEFGLLFENFCLVLSVSLLLPPCRASLTNCLLSGLGDPSSTWDVSSLTAETAEEPSQSRMNSNVSQCKDGY